ncbi:hypothetical protein ACFFUS_12070 [Vibrio gallaecicus]|uniref:hypothetical protein n=1 Tax=Vibrio gallaecicus TaxID=552386 RepID=UPI0010C9DA9F|nr:hypothetical protein [Vibrio gallaecicus]MDN3617530.1 hypothetical protein [Vibrio gallaecicus]
MASTEQVKNLLSLMDEITEIDIADLIYDSNWGSINFENAESDLERLYALCNHFKVLPLEQLPDDVADQIVSHGTPISQTVNNIRNFTIEQSNPSGVRDQYVREVKSNVDSFYKFSHIYVPYLAYQKGEVQSNIKQLTSSVSDAKNLLTTTKKEISSKNEAIEKIVQAAREASASVGVAHFTADFDTEAKTMQTQAGNWLKATIVLAFLSLISAVYFLFATPDITTTASAIQYVSSKILILVLLITATLWCGNLYKAAMHQSAANKFKANSLKTFQAFVNATDDSGIRDAVLVETTRAIFSESATGYLQNENSSTEKSTKIVEVVKNSAQTVAAATKS